jgi:hypothetical protein
MANTLSLHDALPISTAGMRMAYEIDKRLGRAALTETIANGAGDFFVKYRGLCMQFDDVPKLDEAVLNGMK